MDHVHWIKRELSICQFLLYQNLVSFPVLSQTRPQAPLLMVPAQTSSKTGTALIAVALVFWPLSEHKRWNWRRTWRDMETTDETDRSGSNNKRQLFVIRQVSILTRLSRTWTRALETLSWYPDSCSSLCTTAFFLCATQRQSAVTLVFAIVYDTDCLQPLLQTRGWSLWSSGNRWCSWCRWFLDTSGRVLAVATVVVCQWLQHVRLWLPVGGFSTWRVKVLGCASPVGVSLLREAHTAPRRSQCTNGSSNCWSTAVLESRLARSKLDTQLPRKTRQSVWPPREGSSSWRLASTLGPAAVCTLWISAGRSTVWCVAICRAWCCEIPSQRAVVNNPEPGAQVWARVRACPCQSRRSCPGERPAWSSASESGTQAGAERVVREGALDHYSPHRQSVSTCRLSCLQQVTVTKAREAKTTDAHLREPSSQSCLGQVP